MFIDFKSLFSDRAEDLNQEFSFDFSGESLPGYSVENPCKGVVSFYPEGEIVRVVLNTKVNVFGDCVRCLQPVTKSVSLRRTVYVRQSLIHDEDESLPFTEDDKLDLREFVLTEIFTSAPTVLLCSEDCVGICPVCGKHRTENCGCENQPTDERLAILKQLLS